MRRKGLFYLVASVLIVASSAWGAPPIINATGDTVNTFLGYLAGFQFVNSNVNATGQNDTFLGAWAGTSNTSGSDNTFVGHGSGNQNTFGSGNTFVGYYAGLQNTGTGNTSVGAEAGKSNTGGGFNSFFGFSSGWSTATKIIKESGQDVGVHPNYNSFFGAQAGYSNTVGGDNSFFGMNAGYSNSDVLKIDTTQYGSRNSFFGSNAGYSNISGSGNVFIGFKAGYKEDSNNKLYIDNCFTGGDCTQALIKGDFEARTLQIDGSLTMVSVATPSDIRYKKEIHPIESSLDKVLQLQGVTYEWDKGKVKGAGYKGGRQIGFVAQEVEKVIPELVHTDSNGYKTLSYDKVVPILAEAIKEQQREIKEKSNRIERLEKALELLERRLASLEQPSRTIASK